uniref:DAGKc domain-containing protein n=1 Tax=Mesocestoides corti TaxID=53468 RepID=A0A5K3FRY6_MESCO
MSAVFGSNSAIICSPLTINCEPSSEWPQPDLNDKPKKPLVYAIDDLLCVSGHTLTYSTSHCEFVSCWFASKHSDRPYPGSVAVDCEGLYLTDQNHPRYAILFTWSRVLRWVEHTVGHRSFFRVYITGLIHPRTPTDVDFVAATHRGHSLDMDGFAYDASLGVCCLMILVEDQAGFNRFSVAFQRHAWCCHNKPTRQRYLLLLNKVSGQGKSVEIVRTIAGPLLTLSGISFDVVETGW